MQRGYLLIHILCLFGAYSKAQNPDDALRSAWFQPGGTARSLAIGGAMGSLGGDMATIHTNPAGLGLYKTAEWALSPAFQLNTNNFDFRNNPDRTTRNSFGFGTSGYIDGGHPDAYSNEITHTYGISISQTATYGNQVQFSGLNDFSSYSEQYVEELVRDGANIDAAANNYITGSSLAFFTYLVDSLADPQGNLIGYRSLVPVGEGMGVQQDFDEIRSGGRYDISFGYGMNVKNKWLFGATVSLPLSVYSSDLTFIESDPTDIENNFAYSQLEQSFRSFGFGINAILGVIYRPQDYIRFGLALHTPSYMLFSDRIKASMTTDTEGYKGVQTKNSFDADFGGNEWITRDYAQLTPWKAILSGSYVFRETQDTRLQRGFVTADLEYINYRGARFSQVSEDPDPSYDSYLLFANQINKDYLKGALNARLGGEFKIAPLAFRAGVAYYSSPYQYVPVNAHRLLLSGGIGYRYQGFFIDLTYVHAQNKDIQFPYRLNDVANVFATWKNSRGQIMATFGFKF
jgi:hypothetical protein